jgi:hypothetical protein
VPLSKPEESNAEMVSTPNVLETEETVEHSATNASSIVAEETIQLLEGRLVVNLHKRKVGEVIVRKEIETRIVEVPVRREKLIVEQVSPEAKQLAVIDLGQTQETEFDALQVSDNMLLPTVEGRFTSADKAIQFLQAVTAQSSPGLQNVQVIIALDDSSHQEKYQSWLENGSTNKLSL